MSDEQSRRPDISRITARLWVAGAIDTGDRRSARSAADTVADLGVELVVDCRAGADDSLLWAARRRMTYRNLGVEDSGRPLPDEFFTEGVELILEHLVAHPGAVLVHCEFGSNRSPALAMAVLLADGLEPALATRLVLEARSAARDRYFADAIRWFEWFSGAD